MDANVSVAAPTIRETLTACGWAVVRNAVPRVAIETALRRLHLDVVERGLPKEVFDDYLHRMCWFPHLRWEPEIVALAEHLPADLRRGEMCEPQILLQPPDAVEEWPIEPHVDELPPWASDRDYDVIVGVALSPNHEANGGVRVWPFDGDGPVPLELRTGDLLVMHPKLPHSGGLNREGSIRYAIYFRFLA
jgi:ectoine hydroxylase-related dioxygenase (phytanoyl-CoA dioxygenase family)